MKLGRRGYSVMFALCFLFLLSVMDYPFVSRIVNERSTKGAVISYGEGCICLRYTGRDAGHL